MWRPKIRLWRKTSILQGFYWPCNGHDSISPRYALGPKLATWSRMQSKKSRSLCILKGKITKNTFSIHAADVPTIKERSDALERTTTAPRRMAATSKPPLRSYGQRGHQAPTSRVCCPQYGVMPQLQSSLKC